MMCAVKHNTGTVLECLYSSIWGKRFFLGSRWESCAVNVGVYGYPNTVDADPGSCERRYTQRQRRRGGARFDPIEECGTSI